MVAKGAETVSAEVANALKQVNAHAHVSYAVREASLTWLEAGNTATYSSHHCVLQAHAKSGMYMNQRMAELYQEMGLAAPPQGGAK
eukprot:scaffold179179_cov36-Tisochrysis_lutea.AAC.2